MGPTLCLSSCQARIASSGGDRAGSGRPGLSVALYRVRFPTGVGRSGRRREVFGPDRRPAAELLAAYIGLGPTSPAVGRGNGVGGCWIESLSGHIPCGRRGRPRRRGPTMASCRMPVCRSHAPLLCPKATWQSLPRMYTTVQRSTVGNQGPSYMLLAPICTYLVTYLSASLVIYSSK